MVRTRAQAVAHALASHTNRPGTCQLWTRTMFNAPSAGDQDGDGDADAVDGWKSEPKSARHEGDRHPPEGVPVAWSGGRHGFGHRAISLGKGKIRSTDAGGSGRVATVDLGWVERHWGLHYLGWSETIDGVKIPGAAPKAKPKPKPKPKPAPKPEGRYKDFTVHLVSGNKTQTMGSVKRDMALVKENSGRSAVVFNTERSSDELRLAVARGLGKGFKVAFNNENPIAYGGSWKVQGDDEALLLAKEDPSKAHVSPNRYLDTLPLENSGLKGVTICFKGTHLVSEANCKHTRVLGRAWREKTWKIQVDDVLDDVAHDHEEGFPVVLAGDFNTGIHFNGHQLFDLLQRRFGNLATHVHNGSLDHVFLISTKDVKLSELGVERLRNTASDHDMISARIRAEVR
jgi:hypothetical protein